jgi:uncharacterized protein YggE
MEYAGSRFAPFRAVRKAHARIALAVGLIAAVVATPVVSAQVSTPVPADEIVRTIAVSGTGTVSVEPDTADVTFSVQSDSELLKEAQADSTTRLEGITEELTSGGVSEADIVTSGYYVTVINEYDDDGNFERISGYRVDAQITATIRDLETLGTLLDSVTTAGANGIYGLYFYVNDPGPAATQARAAAMEDARAKADQLAAASGVTITGVVSINETWAPSPVSKDFYQQAGGMGGAEMDAAAAPVSVSPGSTDITVELQVVFEINQPNG